MTHNLISNKWPPDLEDDPGIVTPLPGRLPLGRQAARSGSRVQLSSRVVPPSLAGTLTVDAYGLPRYWLLVWTVLFGSGRKASTRLKTYAAAEHLYEVARLTHGDDCLDRLISRLDVTALIALLEALFIRLRNDSLDRKINHRQTWKYAHRFLLQILKQICVIEGIPSASELQTAASRIDDQFSLLVTGSENSVVRLRAFAAEVLQEIYEIIEAGSVRNPFRTERNRVRNHLLLMLFIHLGLRKGEVCLLTLSSFFEALDERTGQRRYWVNVTEPPEDDWDPRTGRPSLKTTYSHRQIPIAEELYHLVLFYVDNFRGNPDHGFLFNSQKRGPIAQNTINEVFKRITGCLSAEARSLLKLRNEVHNLQPHGCRHTAVVVRLKQMLDQGMPMPEATASLRVYFGWSRESDMPLHYGKAYFEERLHTVWDPRWDAHVSHLRELASDR